MARAASASPFWSIALASDIYDRGGHRGDNQVLDDWIDIHRQVAVSGNLGATYPGNALGALANIGNSEGWSLPRGYDFPVILIRRPPPPPPPPPPEKRKCCPKSISFDLEERLDDPCRPGATFRVDAEWSNKPEPCDCDCCEVRQFLRFSNYAIGGIASLTAADFPVPPYVVQRSSVDELLGSDDPWTVHDLGEDGNFIQDHAFATAYDDAGNVSEMESATVIAMQMKVRADGRDKWDKHLLRYGVNFPGDKILTVRR